MAIVPMAFVRRYWFALLNGVFWIATGLEAFGTAIVLKSQVYQLPWFVVLRVIPGWLFCAWLHRQLCSRPTWSVLRGWQRAALVIGSLSGFVLALSALLRLGRLWLGLADPTMTLAKFWIYVAGFELRVLVWAGFYLLILGSRDLRQSEQSRGQQEQALMQAQLRFLSSAFQPHFLMNGLNAIVACREKPEQVRDAATGLANYLRYALERGQALEPLHHQLRALRHYITVQELRFGERLNCRMTIDPDVLKLQVPRFLLQPLLENACKHGESDTNGVLQVLVCCRRESDRLILSVRNSGRWQGPRQGGYGVEAVRKQLALNYGSQCSFSVNDDDGSSTVTLELPAEMCANA
jgi:two-component system LytT family sensor kinase